MTEESRKFLDLSSYGITQETTGTGIRGQRTYRVYASGRDGAIGAQGSDLAELARIITRAEGPGSVVSVTPDSKIRVSRIGDAERDKALSDLSRHFSEGRLPLAEYQERSDLAIRAASQPELDDLFRDLPALRMWHEEHLVPAESLKDMAIMVSRLRTQKNAAVAALVWLMGFMLILLVTGVIH